MEQMKQTGSKGHAVQGPGSLDETAARLAQVIDSRLAEVWLEVFAADQEQLAELMPWLLRMAYLSGHRDAQESPDELSRSLGVRDAGRTR